MTAYVYIRDGKDQRLDAIREEVRSIFQEAQISSANHGKNCVRLYNLFCEANNMVTRSKKGDKALGSKEFQHAFFLTFMRSFDCKKVDAPADRIAKFVGAYIKHMNEKEAETRQEEEVDDDDDTHGAKFTKNLSFLLVDGFEVGNKNVRYRCVYGFSEMVKHLGILDEETYVKLRASLLGRLLDREKSIRAKAAASLALLCAAEEDSEDNDESISVHDALFDKLAHDSDAEVRKAILCNVRVDKESLPHILERLPDVDTGIRKAVYLQVLKPNVLLEKEGEWEIGPCHPSKLRPVQRHRIMRHGLRDRDPFVRKAAESLMEAWVKAYDSMATKPEEGDQPRPVDAGLIALLRELNVQTQDHEVLDSITRMVKAVFRARTDIFDGITFGDKRYWQNGIQLERAFMIRVFVEYCYEIKRNSKLDEFLPSVLEMAEIVRLRYKAFEGLFNAATPDESEMENSESILTELLRLTVYLDFMDHTGAHRMKAAIRHMLLENMLSDSLLEPCLDVLEALSAHDFEFLCTVCEIIKELRDGGEDDRLPKNEDPDSSTDGVHPELPPFVPLFQRPRSEMDAETRMELNNIDLRCLIICCGMLKRIQKDLRTDRQVQPLHRLLTELVSPAVKNCENFFEDSSNGDSPEREMYESMFEQSLTALGLSALIAKPWALKTFKQFATSIDKAFITDSGRLLLIQGMLDLVMHYKSSLLHLNDDPDISLQNIVDGLVDQISQQSGNPSALALVCQGLAKLAWQNVIEDPVSLFNLFRTLVLPETSGNEELRQCLQYFFPRYSFSSVERQTAMKDIFIPVFANMAEERMKANDEGIEVITSTQLCQMFEWYTNPEELERNLSAAGISTKGGNLVDHAIQLSFARAILEGLLSKNVKFEKDDKKALLQCLGRIPLPDKVDDLEVCKVYILVDKLRKCRPPRDGPSNTALMKFETAFASKYEKQLEGMSTDEFRKYENLCELFEYLDDIIPEDDESSTETDGPRRRGKKRRSMSSAAWTTNSEIEDVKPVISLIDHRNPAKRRRMSRVPDDDLQNRSSNTPAPLPQPRPRPVRAKSPPEVIVISSDSEEDERPPPRPRTNNSGSFRHANRQEFKEEENEEDISRDLSRLLSANTLGENTFDSIMDSGPEDEDEDEDEEELQVANTLIEESD